MSNKQTINGHICSLCMNKYIISNIVIVVVWSVFGKYALILPQFVVCLYCTLSLCWKMWVEISAFILCIIVYFHAILFSKPRYMYTCLYKYCIFFSDCCCYFSCFTAMLRSLSLQNRNKKFNPTHTDVCACKCVCIVWSMLLFTFWMPIIFPCCEFRDLCHLHTHTAAAKCGQLKIFSRFCRCNERREEDENWRIKHFIHLIQI